MNIQWYPGHMAKTKRQMIENLKNIDIICEIVDARIPMVSRNPDIDEIAGKKPRMIILNRTDLADVEQTKKWSVFFKKKGWAVLQTDSQHGKGTEKFSTVLKDVLSEKIEMWNAKGQTGRAVRVMIVGIPNVGKSTFINRILGRKSAKAADKPGVTRGAQWFRVSEGIDLLDTPGILWPRFDDEKTGLLLAATGAIKDDILDIETLACKLFEILYQKARENIKDRYKLCFPQDEIDFLGYFLLEQAGKNRGFMLRGGNIDTERMARIFLDEYRGGVLGKITLETPDDYKEEQNLC